MLYALLAQMIPLCAASVSAAKQNEEVCKPSFRCHAFKNVALMLRSAKSTGFSSSTALLPCQVLCALHVETIGAAKVAVGKEA